MPIWSEILAELAATAEPEKPPNFDYVRRKYIVQLYEHSKRNTILYASGWLQKQNTQPDAISINDEDMQAFMEVSHGLKGENLDLILHSPGGSIEAAEAIVSYLRSRFSNIRVIVPQLAMSAATMIACAADKIVLGKHSSLGPTDPQIIIPTYFGVRSVPAQAVLDQFDLAKEECVDPARLSAWLPMLSQYGPDLLVRCESALQLSRELVKAWLESYMFKHVDDPSEKAEQISNWLADHKNFKSHGRHIPRVDLENRELAVEKLEDDEVFEDLVLSVYHATTHTFSGTSSVKIVENHIGRAFIKHHIPQEVPMVQGSPMKPLAPRGS